MFIVNSYTLAIIFCFITMICWGSWGNTQKLASKNHFQEKEVLRYKSRIWSPRVLISLPPMPAVDTVFLVAPLLQHRLLPLPQPI